MIYLDHAATTDIHKEVLDAMLPWFHPSHTGNPSSVHTRGLSAKKAIEEARVRVAKLINAEPDEIYFTSGGTEANNTWLRSLSKHIVFTTKVEHKSVLEPIRRGIIHSVFIEGKYIPVNTDGTVDLEALDYALSSYGNIVGGVSAMWVNNEIGSVNNVKAVADICHRHKVVFHTDAVQAVGHIPVDVKRTGVDMLSMSGHKFGAPHGVGALYIRNGTPKAPLILGGGQEKGLRGGTENVAAIVGMGVAASLVMDNLDSWRTRWERLRSSFIKELRTHLLCEFMINGGPNTVDNIVSLTVPGVEGESLLTFLDYNDVCVSAGSACSAKNQSPSHVLTGIGLPVELAMSTIRVSFGTATTNDEVVEAAHKIASAVQRLRNKAALFSPYRDN